eukprot:1356873-Pleurochrysis_carterae.AAC.1
MGDTLEECSAVADALTASRAQAVRHSAALFVAAPVPAIDAVIRTAPVTTTTAGSTPPVGTLRRRLDFVLRLLVWHEGAAG